MVQKMIEYASKHLNEEQQEESLMVESLALICMFK